MLNKRPPFYSVAHHVAKALQQNKPVVALESTVITHGLPYPKNVELARDMETVIKNQNAVPASIGVHKGKVTVGLSESEIEHMATSTNIRKISVRDYAAAITQKIDGGTTVAGTLIAAAETGIRVFATGGIGGVHRDAPFDISADLPQLGKSPVVVVCAGAKSILDIPATIEYLETMSVPVIGYKTEDFPAFYTTKSGLPVSATAQSAKEVADIALAHWDMGMRSAILLVVPPPAEFALKGSDMEAVIKMAIEEAKVKKIRGQKVTPFLLSKVSELTDGESMATNLALLNNNALVAAKVSQHIYKPSGNLI
jgi:pseudouridylate synthase